MVAYGSWSFTTRSTKTNKLRLPLGNVKFGHTDESYFVEGDRGGETGRKGGRRCTGGERRGGGKRDSQGGGKREKKRKITQHCAIFRNRKNAKRREPTNTGGKGD